MVGAAIVLLLATLVIPIALIVAALAFDLLFLGWYAARTIRTRVLPAIGERLVKVGGVPQRRTA